MLAEAAAIYGAIQELNIVYAVGPAHFEEVGQRIRLVENIIDAKLGNCIELSLLYAACLEAVGLSPLLCLTDDHVFAGVWLVDAPFPKRSYTTLRSCRSGSRRASTRSRSSNAPA